MSTYDIFWETYCNEDCDEDCGKTTLNAENAEDAIKKFISNTMNAYKCILYISPDK